ncbi:HPr(Ser) kinase/phosphatase [Marinisporobacter balticus]|uniref:HPr kinase/phosphorylase n=1 Tax=Marinisporobacter balticus TaxID=2018667 RepID=A0A4R2KEU8_9FIRM|nr:HPr(Ser) kinase/phosphatase [Marinisporobacter balticus]TCO70737.1 Hpr(Ser) kinase/phosphatase [Marinisporobacter balticus]
MAFVTIENLIEDLQLEVIHRSEETEINIEESDINRPGLQLAGFYEYFAYERVQVIGKVEWTYFDSLDAQVRKPRTEKLFSHALPCVIVARGLDVHKECLEAAKKFNRPLLRTDVSTTQLISQLNNYLNDKLAPVITRHGVLVDVYGIGILISGESGIGKSETALELIKRGHRLVADDAVEIKKKDKNRLEGSAPEVIRHFMELRGIGILDIKHLYGVGAVRNKKTIELVIEMENWKPEKHYDRLGMDEEFMEILDVNIYKITIPIKPGRNLAMIIEAAAKNHRQKRMGYNAAEKLNERLLKYTSKQTKNKGI